MVCFLLRSSFCDQLLLLFLHTKNTHTHRARVLSVCCPYLHVFNQNPHPRRRQTIASTIHLHVESENKGDRRASGRRASSAACWYSSMHLIHAFYIAGSDESCHKNCRESRGKKKDSAACPPPPLPFVSCTKKTPVPLSQGGRRSSPCAVWRRAVCPVYLSVHVLYYTLNHPPLPTHMCKTITSSPLLCASVRGYVHPTSSSPLIQSTDCTA